MIAAILVPILLIGLIGLGSEGMWGGVVVGVLLIGLVLLLMLGEMETTRAWRNRTRWWARGGPDQYRRKR